jgi:hypothetical protein
MEQIIGDPAVKVVTFAPGRPYALPSRLDTEMFRLLEEARRRLYPNAITIPSMLTAATDLAQLRVKGVQAYGVGPPAPSLNRERRPSGKRQFVHTIFGIAG